MKPVGNKAPDLLCYRAGAQGSGIFSFRGLPTPLDAVRRCVSRSISSLNRSPPSAQPLCKAFHSSSKNLLNPLAELV